MASNKENVLPLTLGKGTSHGLSNSTSATTSLSSLARHGSNVSQFSRRDYHTGTLNSSASTGNFRSSVTALNSTNQFKYTSIYSMPAPFEEDTQLAQIYQGNPSFIAAYSQRNSMRSPYLPTYDTSRHLEESPTQELKDTGTVVRVIGVPANLMYMPRPPKIKKPKNVNIPKDAKCKVCEREATGMNYSVLTCDGCAQFFKRTRCGRTKFTCFRRKNNCPINNTINTYCQRCRLNKCLAVGMCGPSDAKDNDDA